MGCEIMPLAKCHTCGKTLIAPYDGKPYWCTKCSYEEEYMKEKRRKKNA
jgi:DNA-directed RNA polymerase subunit RPC12/RpoP